MPNAPRQFRLGPSKDQQTKQYDKRRGSAAERGYDTRWQKFVKWLKQQPEHVLCGMCEQAPTELFDHVEAIGGPNDPLLYELSNILGECKACHNRKTILCDGGFGKARTNEGQRLFERLKEVATRRAESIEARGAC